MTKRHVSLYDENDNPAPVSGVRQELVTIEQTEQGIRIVRFKKRFKQGEILESFESEPIQLSSVLPVFPTPEKAGLVRG